MHSEPQPADTRALLVTAGGVLIAALVVCQVFLEPLGILQQPWIQLVFAGTVTVLYTKFFVPVLEKSRTFPGSLFAARLTILHLPLYAMVLHYVLGPLGANPVAHVVLMVLVGLPFLYFFARWFFSLKRSLIIFVFVSTFLFSVFVRLPLVSFNLKPGFIDLSIYLTSGKLMALGINPYDYNDNLAEREKLRHNSFYYNAYVCSSIDRWNFYTSGNLPLSMYFYRALYSVNPHDPATAFRLSIVLLDSLLAACVVMFCLLFWKEVSFEMRIFTGLLLAGLSSFLLLDGIVFPNDKGPQTLLMTLAVFCALSGSGGWLLLSAAFLGMSIAFKGLGVFLVPLCACYVLNKKGFTFDLKEIQQLLTAPRVYVYLGATAFFAFIWFVPFLPEVFGMMNNRLAGGTSMQSPVHSSIWRLAHDVAGDLWVPLKNGFAASLVILGLYGFFKKRIPLEVLTAMMLLVFVVVLLVGGAINRQNIAITMAIVLVGTVFPKDAVTLALFYSGSGLLVYASFLQPAILERLQLGNDREYLISILVLGFILLFTYKVGRMVFPGRKDRGAVA